MRCLRRKASRPSRQLGSDQPRRCAEGPVFADRRRRRRQDHQIGIRKSARRRRHQPRAGRRCFRKARQKRRRLGQSRRDGIGPEGQRPLTIIAHGSTTLRLRRIEFRSLAAGARRCFEHLRHQQRRFDHDDPDLWRRLEGDDDFGGGGVGIGYCGYVLQFRRAVDPAPVAGDLGAGQRIAFDQRLIRRHTEPRLRNFVASRTDLSSSVAHPGRAARSPNRHRARWRAPRCWLRPRRVR